MKLNIPYIVKHSDTIWKNIRWAATGGVITCPHCAHAHTYNIRNNRYKCKKCGYCFSDRSNTILHHSRLPLSTWLVAMFQFSVCKECSAIDLQKVLGVNYKTAYTILQKLRYLVGQEEICLSGLTKVDEAYIGAEWKNVHLRKKMSYMKENGYLDDHNRYTKTSLLQAVSAKKCHILSLTDEQNNTLLLHVPNPVTKECIQYIINQPQHSITALVTDESKLYKGLSIPVYTNNHSEHTYQTPEGYTSNVCENRFSWVKRKWNGVYTHTSEKYLQLYLWQRQWNVNHCNDDIEYRFNRLLHLGSKCTITCSDVFNFDYKAGYPKSRRKIAEEEAEAVIEDFGGTGLIESVTDDYGRKYKVR